MCESNITSKKQSLGISSKTIFVGILKIFFFLLISINKTFKNKSKPHDGSVRRIPVYYLLYSFPGLRRGQRRRKQSCRYTVSILSTAHYVEKKNKKKKIDVNLYRYLYRLHRNVVFARFLLYILHSITIYFAQYTLRNTPARRPLTPLLYLLPWYAYTALGLYHTSSFHFPLQHLFLPCTLYRYTCIFIYVYVLFIYYIILLSIFLPPRP